MKRPNPIPERHPHSDDELEELARDAAYVGSPEHKAKRWWGGTPEARIGKDGKARRPKKQLTTICPLVSRDDKRRATHWIREAIRQRRFRFVEGDKRFPKHVWYTDREGRSWEGFCVNSHKGEYKGWPANPREAGKRRK